MSQPPPSPPPGSNSGAAHAPTPQSILQERRRRWVPTMIALAVLLFLATEALLYYRWATMNEPTCVLIVDGAAPLRGAQVTVNAPRLPKPYTATLGEGERFTLPFYLEPDTYTVTLTLRGTTLYERQVELTNRERGKEIDLSMLTPPPATAPTTAP